MPYFKNIMKKTALFILIVFLLAGCGRRRESLRYDRRETALIAKEQRINSQTEILIDGAIIGGGLVLLISLIGFAVFYSLGKK
ncbi:MAG: hypothetical protein K9M00_01840 [Candidatus Omnitrophica bacterium]|nr:hypothetical protein [Candidatus Omnitrophota bacterium]